MVYGDASYIDENGKVIGRFPAAQTDYAKLRRGYVHIPQQSAFFRGDLWRKVGPLDDSFYFAMDYDLWVRLAANAPLHYYPRMWANFRLHSGAKTIAADDRYFASSPSDPLYRFAYYPHNIHFAMVSAQMGGDRATALDAARRLDASIAPEVALKFPIMQPVKAAPFATHALFGDAESILRLAAPPEELLLVRAMYHYARAVAHAQRLDIRGAKAEIAILERLERDGDFRPFADWQVPAKEVIQTARLVATGRLADALGDLEAAAKAYEDAIFLEDSLAYMEPPYWHYPVRQSLGSVRLRQGRLDDAERAFRDSLARVRNNGWALAGLAETYRRKQEPRSERATRAALARAWFGPAAGPDLSRL